MTDGFLPYGDCDLDCGCRGSAHWPVLALIALASFTVALRLFTVLARDPLAEFELRRTT